MYGIVEVLLYFLFLIWLNSEQEPKMNMSLLYLKGSYIIIICLKYECISTNPYSWLLNSSGMRNNLMAKSKQFICALEPNRETFLHKSFVV